MHRVRVLATVAIFLFIIVNTGYWSSSAPCPAGTRCNIILGANKVPVKPKNEYVEVALLLIVFFLEPLSLVTSLKVGCLIWPEIFLHYVASNCPWSSPNLLFRGYWRHFSWGKAASTWTDNCHLISRLRMLGAMFLLPHRVPLCTA
jgi:hypothetical protein